VCLARFCRHRRRDLRVHRRDEPDGQPAVLPVDLHAVRGPGPDDVRDPGRAVPLAHGGRRVRRDVRRRFRRAVLRAVHAHVAAGPRPGRGGPEGGTVVRVRAGPHRRPAHAAAAAVRGRGHGHAEPGRLDGGRHRGDEQGLLGHVHGAHRLEARARRPGVLLLPTGVRVLRAVVLLGGRDARLPRVHRRHDRGRVPVRRPAGRHRRQPRVPVRAQAQADRLLGTGHVRVHVHRGRLPVRVRRRGRPAGRRPVDRAVPVVRVLRHVRRAAVAVERVRRDVPDGRQGHHERRPVLVRLRAHVRRHQGVPDAGVHFRHPGRVDGMRRRVLRHLAVRRVRPARDHRHDAKRDRRRVQTVQRQSPSRQKRSCQASNTVKIRHHSTSPPRPRF